MPHQVPGPNRDSPRTQGNSRWDVAVRIVAGLVSVAVGALWLFCTYLVLISRFSTDPANDPHGYGLIIGTILAIPAGLVVALTLPFAFPREDRARAIRITTPTFTIASVLLIMALFMQ